MNGKKTIKNILVIILLTLLWVLPVLLVVKTSDDFTLSNNEQEIEQYYTNNGNDIVKELDFLSNFEFNPIIYSYTEYIYMFGNNEEILNLLQNVVDKNFFDTKSLIILTDSTTSAANPEELNGHVSELQIVNNIANITIKREKKERGCFSTQTRLYFIPINNKNVTEVNAKVEFPLDILDILYISRVIPFIIFGISLQYFIKKRNRIKTFEYDEEQKKIKFKKSKIMLLISAIICGILEFILEIIHFVTTSFAAKPIIYLYPDTDKKVSVKLGYKDNITVSYPTYSTGWNVFAKTDGNLIDLDTNKNLYSLYYESKNIHKFKIEKDGFIVKRDEITEFLEDKLSILGLNDREKEEFIIYWLPILQKNKYCYIRFATIDEINSNMPLEITPCPDTLIRVLMTFKGLEKPLDIIEQQLPNQERIGFTAVEWGGTEIK